LKENSSPCASFLTASLLSPKTISGSVMPSFVVQLPRGREYQRGVRARRVAAPTQEPS
jgi:hypothetical protein